MVIHLWQIETSTYQQEYINHSKFRATLAPRMKETIFNPVVLKFDNLPIWSGSKTVLQYIRNENVKFNTYIMPELAR